MENLKASPIVEPVMTFPEALNKVIDGKKVTKTEWNNDKIYVLLKDGFLMIRKDDGKFYQLIVSEADLIGTDWIEIPGAN